MAVSVTTITTTGVWKGPVVGSDNANSGGPTGTPLWVELQEPALLHKSDTVEGPS